MSIVSTASSLKGRNRAVSPRDALTNRPNSNVLDAIDVAGGNQIDTDTMKHRRKSTKISQKKYSGSKLQQSMLARVRNMSHIRISLLAI